MGRTVACEHRPGRDEARGERPSGPLSLAAGSMQAVAPRSVYSAVAAAFPFFLRRGLEVPRHAGAHRGANAQRTSLPHKASGDARANESYACVERTCLGVLMPAILVARRWSEEHVQRFGS